MELGDDLKPKHKWTLEKAKSVEQPDGSVRLEAAVTRDGKQVAQLLLVGGLSVKDATDLQLWWMPTGGG